MLAIKNKTQQKYSLIFYFVKLYPFFNKKRKSIAFCKKLNRISGFLYLIIIFGMNAFQTTLKNWMKQLGYDQFSEFYSSSKIVFTLEGKNYMHTFNYM